MQKIGMTTTIPVEVIYAAGLIPVDLNNIFVTHPNPQSLVEEAEIAGYPRNLCAWIKGLYATTLQNDDIRTIVAVTQGDCSNTHALMETLEMAGVKVLPFAFPFDRDYDLLKLQMEKLVTAVGTTWEEVTLAKARLEEVRQRVKEMDRLTWQGDRVSGWDNHLFQVCCSDFEGDPEAFASRLDAYLAELPQRDPIKADIRLAYIGVPPIMDDLYDYLEERGQGSFLTRCSASSPCPLTSTILWNNIEPTVIPMVSFIVWKILLGN